MVRTQREIPTLSPPCACLWSSESVNIQTNLFSDACRYMPGGVNSPVRAFRGVGGEPVFVARASGAYVFDTDDRRYIDYVGSWGPMVLGHAHPDVIKVV